jgi:tyrosine-protein kinase Etk/Wzc
MNSSSHHDVPQPLSDVPAPISLMGLNFLLMAWHKKNLLLGTASISLLLGLTVALVSKPYYTAETTLLPPQQSPSSPSGMLAQLGGAGAASGLLGGSALKSQGDVYTGIMKSETVEDGLIQRFRLVDRFHVKRLSEARKQLESKTLIDAKEKDGFIRLSVTADTPEHALELANGYVEQTKEFSQHLAVGEASQRRLFLEQQMEQAKNKLADAEESLKQTENATGVIQVEAQSRALIESAGILRSQISAKEVQLQSLRTFEAEGNPDVEHAKQELAALQAQLATLNKKDTETSSSGLTGSRGQMSTAGLEYVRKTRDVKYQEAIFEILARQFESAKLDEAREGNLLQIIDPARLPDHRAGPKRAFIIVGFLTAGVFGCLGFLLLQMAYQQKLKDPLIAERVSLLRNSVFKRR